MEKTVNVTLQLKLQKFTSGILSDIDVDKTLNNLEVKDGAGDASVELMEVIDYEVQE